MEFPAELQRLPHRSCPGYHSELRRTTAGVDALGPCAGLVVEAPQGIEASYIQCTRRDGAGKAVLPGLLQAIAVPHPCVGLLRVALRESRRQEREPAAPLLHAPGRPA